VKWWTRKVARQPEPEPEPQPEKVETGDTFRHGDEPPEGKVGIDLFNGPWHGTHLIHEPADTPDGLPTCWESLSTYGISPSGSRPR